MIKLIYSDEGKLNLGWVMIGCCGLVLALNLEVRVYEQIKTLKEAWRSIKKYMEKRNSKTQIHLNDETARGIYISNEISRSQTRQKNQRTVRKRPKQDKMNISMT